MKRWQVVNKNRDPVLSGVADRVVAQSAADAYNQHTEDSHRPYRVMADPFDPENPWGDS